MSLSPPSHVSATTGNDHSSLCMRPRRTTHSITASRTTPTECVLVIITGPHKNPDSSTQVVAVLAAGEDRGDARADRTLPHDELAASRHERAVAHFDTGHIGDGVEWPSRAFEGD